MSTGKAGMSGHAPGVVIGRTERAKYELMWEHPQYRADSPGEQTAAVFLQQARPKRGDEVIDFGCGTGRGGLMLHALGGMRVTFMDFAANALDADVREASVRDPDKWRFVQHDLSRWPFPIARAKYGYCCDVMEHIPPSQVGAVLKNVLRGARHVFFQISTVPDNMGALIGEPLHLTVRPFEWWQEQFRALDCHVHWSHNAGNGALFYVTAFATGDDLKKSMVTNVDLAEMRANVLTNLRLGLAEVEPHELQSKEIMILGGGPSLNDFIDDIRAKRAAGMPLITTNGTYNWAIERGLTPSAQVVVDSREFNKRFVEPVVPTCKYLLCSQVHPATIAAVPREQVLLWHTGAAQFVKDAMDDYAREIGHDVNWTPIYGGSTVMLRTLPLMRVLGYHKFHVYGFDSCFRASEHHAYVQAENDNSKRLELTVGGQTFVCTPWMWSQAHEFIELTRAMGDVFDLEVYGDGLIRHIIQTGADMDMPEGDSTTRYAFVDRTITESNLKE